ncbi:MAG: ABC transporter ATP-binding protein [Clostridia bacterium]|nr:ABC transporter ATP-binding protein [Clostridia bacterium]
MAQDDLLIKAEHITMKFAMASQKTDSLKELIVRLLQGKIRYDKFTALDDISFEVKRGEGLAIIGRNGAGKSTLLRIISGILTPTSGKIKVRGNIAPLLSLGAGFDYNATGRQNVYLNGAILGHTKKFLDARMSEIEDFAELGKFMDMPIKNYSSGMLARLGFSIAMAIQPEILIVDEVLAVGDSVFREKCYSKLAELKAAGTTFIIVTHGNGIVRSLCSRAIWIKDGKVEMDGDVKSVCDSYDKYTKQISLQHVKEVKQIVSDI